LNKYQRFNAPQLSHAALHVLLVALPASDDMHHAFASATSLSFIVDHCVGFPALVDRIGS
jgi:hypothetical protein